MPPLLTGTAAGQSFNLPKDLVIFCRDRNYRFQDEDDTHQCSKRMTRSSPMIGTKGAGGRNLGCLHKVGIRTKYLGLKDEGTIYNGISGRRQCTKSGNGSRIRESQPSIIPPPGRNTKGQRPPKTPHNIPLRTIGSCSSRGERPHRFCLAMTYTLSTCSPRLTHSSFRLQFPKTFPINRFSPNLFEDLRMGL